MTLSCKNNLTQGSRGWNWTDWVRIWTWAQSSSGKWLKFHRKSELQEISQLFLLLFSYKYSDLILSKSGQKQHSPEILTAVGRLQTAGLAAVGVGVLASGALAKVSAGISGIHHTCSKTQTSKKPLHLPESAWTQHCTPTGNSTRLVWLITPM